VPASRTAYAKVFVTVPGTHDKQYFGLYSLVEDVGKEFIEEKLAVKKGALFKPVTPNLFDDLGDDWKNYKQTYDPKGEPTNEQKERVITFAKVVTKADDAEFAQKLPEFLDLDNFARYMALTTWLVDMDGILGVGQNYYLYLHPKTHKFMFFPGIRTRPSANSLVAAPPNNARTSPSTDPGPAIATSSNAFSNRTNSRNSTSPKCRSLIQRSCSRRPFAPKSTSSHRFCEKPFARNLPNDSPNSTKPSLATW
jgi:hypothetical protein